MGFRFMKKLDNFSNCLGDLKEADFTMADNDVIYRTGVIGQFNLSFVLAWKALQAALRLHGVEGAETGSPREILQLGYKTGFINDDSVWLMMLKKRNTIVHVYMESLPILKSPAAMGRPTSRDELGTINEDEASEMLLLIRDSFIPALSDLENTLHEKVKGIEGDESL